MTSTVLPVFLAHASVAALTALVSASPELPIMTVSLTGPFAVACGALLPPLKPPPPQALRASTPVRQAAAAAVVVLRDIVLSCFRVWCGQRHVPVDHGRMAGGSSSDRACLAV